MGKIKRSLSFIFIISFAVLLTSCTAEQTDTTSDAANNGVKIITIAHSAAFRPMDFTNEAGESDGYEVQVLREIDALLPQYEFRFVSIPDDSDLLIGVETGKYDVGVKGAWVTEERQEKYVFPQHPIGATNIGLLYRTSDKDRYTDLESFARENGKLVPIAPQNAQYNVITAFNEEHPDTPIDLIASETFGLADAYRWLIEGRYDGYLDVQTSYLNNIKGADSPYHQYNNKLEYSVYRSLPTWPLFNTDNQDLADAYDEAFLQLLENGKINEIMIKYMGENTFEYIQGEEYQYLKPQK